MRNNFLHRNPRDHNEEFQAASPNDIGGKHCASEKWTSRLLTEVEEGRMKVNVFITKTVGSTHKSEYNAM